MSCLCCVGFILVGASRFVSVSASCLVSLFAPSAPSAPSLSFPSFSTVRDKTNSDTLFFNLLFLGFFLFASYHSFSLSLFVSDGIALFFFFFSRCHSFFFETNLDEQNYTTLTTTTSTNNNNYRSLFVLSSIIVIGKSEIDKRRKKRRNKSKNRSESRVGLCKRRMQGNHHNTIITHDSPVTR